MSLVSNADQTVYIISAVKEKAFESKKANVKKGTRSHIHFTFL